MNPENEKLLAILQAELASWRYRAERIAQYINQHGEDQESREQLANAEGGIAALEHVMKSVEQATASDH